MIQAQIARFARFEIYATCEIFKKIFGPKGWELFRKFQANYNSNFCQFFCQLNHKNQSLILAYLSRYTKDVQ
jgi:hypothetical protein